MADGQTTTTIEEELNRLRSILRSDDHLLLQSCGDYELARLKLDHDIQMTFVFDSLNALTEPLTTANTHDLRISKGSQKCPLTSDQWTALRTYFDQIQRGSTTNNQPSSIYDLVQLLQDRLLQMSVETQRSRGKGKKGANPRVTEPEAAVANTKFRGADLIFNRILHDRMIDQAQVLIGYEDRFTGIHEIAFNEFKKVHDHEYGVPMHRIRHYKINGRLVWDRVQKLDLLTGSEQQLEMIESQTFSQGMYQFDRTAHQWVLCPEAPIVADDPKSPSTAEMCLPERCHILTWNILFDYHHSAAIHTKDRYPMILERLKALLPDIICLQEVTRPFFNLLLNETWLSENNYRFILKKSVINSVQDQSYGQMMLIKNIQPRAWQILPLDETSSKGSKEYIHTRFGVNSKVTIDLLNIHLHSNRSKNPEEKRRQALEMFFTRMEKINYMLVGDVNFGDNDLKEQTFLQQYEPQIHDLWKTMYSLDQNPGFTFDPSTNVCAKITSETQIKRRLDRYLLHPLHNLSYSIEHLSMVGKESFPAGEDQQLIHPSDHYALNLIISFRIRSISHRSALVILPTKETWPLIEPLREEHDPSFNRWPPHVNVLWPFFDVTDTEIDEEKILLPLRMALAGHVAFQAQIQSIETFEENQITFMKFDASSEDQVKTLFHHLKQLFPQCCLHQRNSYNPHLTIGQGKTISPLPTVTPFQFPIAHLSILQRPHENDTEPFRMMYQIPLGSILPPLSARLYPLIDEKLKELFNQFNLYADDQSYQRKQEKFHRLAQCFQSIFSTETLHCFTHQFHAYGSYRLGLRAQDLDTVFVLREHTREQHDETVFDRSLRSLKSDRTAFTHRIAHLIESQIKTTFDNEIIHYQLVEAMYPLIRIAFIDQTRVEIFIDVLQDEHAPIHGVHDIERVLLHARSPILFQYLLSFVRTWAEQMGIYGQVYGYLGGYPWAILCANICHNALSTIRSDEELTLEQFFSLVQSFFSSYARFPWSAQSFHLHSTRPRRIAPLESKSVVQQGSMRILCPAPSDHNSARSTIEATRDLIHRSFEHVHQFLGEINTITKEDQYHALEEILRMSSSFPHDKIRSIVEITMSAENENDLLQWIGWIQSRFIGFFVNCENECHLTIEPRHTLESSKKNPHEKIYSIGVQTSDKQLKSDRRFSHHFTRFLETCRSFAQRKQSMEIDGEILDVQQWKLQRMEPKAQRARRN